MSEPAQLLPSAAEAPRTASALARMLPKLVVSLALGALFSWLFARGGVPLLPPFHAIA